MKANQQGFTLIELLVVIAIIGILSAVAVPQYQKYVQRAEVSAAVASVNSLRTAVDAAIFSNEAKDNDELKEAVLGTTTLPSGIKTFDGHQTEAVVIESEIGGTGGKVIGLHRSTAGVWVCYTDATDSGQNPDAIYDFIPDACQNVKPTN